MRGVVETTPNLCVREGTVSELLIDSRNEEVRGVRTLYGMEFLAPTVVLTAGTLSGRLGPHDHECQCHAHVHSSLMFSVVVSRVPFQT